MAVSSSGSGGGDCGSSLGRDCAGGTTRLSFTGGQNGPAEQDTTPWGSPGPPPQDAVSDVVLCTPPLPSVENIHQTVDGRWRQFAGAPPTALRTTSTIRRTMVLHGCDIYSGALTTGRTGPRRHTAPSPGDEDEKFTSAHVQVRRVATPSKHPAGGRNPKVVEDDCSGCHLSPIPRCREREPRGGAKGMQSHIRQEVPALAFFA